MPSGSKVAFATDADGKGTAAAGGKKLPPARKDAKAADELAASVPPAFKRRNEVEAELGVSRRTTRSGEPDPPPQRFVGLKNLGATCYMNALLQTMFMTPELRKHIVEWVFEPKQQHPMNVAYQLQLLFARMQDVGLRRFANPADLVKSFGMGSDAHREQHDVQELNRVLLDVLQEFIDKADAPQTLRALYRGEMIDYRECQNCHSRREDAVPYFDISLPLCSPMGPQYDAEIGFGAVDSVDVCMSKLVEVETIDGISCDACGGKHPIRKGQRFSARAMPLVLTVQLVRMSYDIETGRRVKIDKDVALPSTLDLGPWTGEPAAPHLPFAIHSVIAHRGNAYHGHYYAFIRVPGDDGEDVWYKFDDDDVTVATRDEILEYTDPAAWRAAAPPPPSAGTKVDGEGGDAAAKPLAADEPADDVEAFVGSLFDGNGGSASSSGPRRNTSGQAYYVIYRDEGRASMRPAATLAFQPPPYVERLLQDERAHVRALHDELARLSRILNVALFAGDLEAGALEPPSGSSAAASLRKAWVEAAEDWTVAQLRAAVADALTPTERAWLAEAPARRLRAFNESLGVAGDSYDDESATLAALGMSAASTAFSSVCTERAAAHDVPHFAPVTGWDTSLQLHFQSLDDPRAFDEVRTAVVMLHRGSTAADLAALVRRRFAARLRAPAGTVRLTARKNGDGVELNVAAGAPALGDAGVVSDDHIFVESADGDNGGGAAEAVGFLARTHLMQIHYVLVKPTEDPLAPTTPAVTVDVDRRMTVRKLKLMLCELAGGLDDKAAQILFEDSAREVRNLDMTLSTMVLGEREARVLLLPFPPIADDHCFCDVFTADTPIDYANPVRFLARFTVDPQTRIEEVIAKAVPEWPPNLVRARLMSTGKTRSLGVPLWNPVVLQNATPQQAASEVRVVLERIARPESLEKGSLILHLHRWFRTVADPAAAFGPGHEVVLHKEMPASVLRETVAEISGIPAEHLECGPAKFYAVQTHDGVYTKVPWGLMSDEKVLAKAVAAAPLKLDHDEIILYCDAREEWAFVTETAKSKGYLNASGLPINGGAKSGKGCLKNRGETGEATKKKPRSEVGIHIRAVWDYEGDAGATEDATATDEPTSQADAAPPVANAAPEENSGGGGAAPAIADFLPYEPYSAGLHGSLEETCLVCHAPFADGEIVHVLMCNHIFHQDCLKPWLVIRPTCPQCNTHVLGG